MIACRPFTYGTVTQRQEWRSLIASLEQALRLHRHVPGRLIRLDAYLHERTDGMIGSLSHLIRGAAVEAILDGTERITKETLDHVRIAATEDGRSSVYGWDVDGCMVTLRRGHGPLAVKRRGGDLHARLG